jgi:MarC family membrane protein
MLQLFLSAFTTLFLVIDPPGCAPIYAGLTTHASARQATQMALRACVIATGILVVFALFGEALLGALHIELASFRIAGGIMLFLIALDMVFEKRTERREERAERCATRSRTWKTSRSFPWPCRCWQGRARSPRSCCSPRAPTAPRKPPWSSPRWAWSWC